MPMTMDESSSPSNRRSHRAPVLLKANLAAGGRDFGVKLRNLSEDGALVEADELPSEGETAKFERNELSVPCQLMWVEGRFAGIKFSRPLKTESVLRHVPPPRPVKAPVFKRPGIACRPLTETERKTVEQWMTDISGTRPGE
jgi:hypothetical protein